MATAYGTQAGHEAQACCHADAGQAQHAHADAAPSAHAGHAHQGGWRGAASVTLHCLTGCAIGELAGLAIGVSLGWQPTVTVSVAVVLSFVSGFALTLLPMLRRGFNFLESFRTVWVGEVISISVMELVMNIVDYRMGGMRGVSLVSIQYWEAFALALVAGFLAAWPVNAWMLSRNMKRCH
ncbi:MAG TPA: DUF4396 domain-containing protein [Nevskia sp.]|nr:DUF4396 domain-containing protein [Nevskia sp.]